MKDDQRTTVTKRMLREGLLRLLKTKDLNKISVTELCNESGINRATFYRHYTQPRDILTELRYTIFHDVREMARKRDLQNDLLSYLEDTCAYFYENAEILNILFSCRTDDDFVFLLNDMFKKDFPELRSRAPFKDIDEDSMRLGAYYFAGGIYYVLRQWLSEPINKTPKDIAQLIYHILKAN